MTPAPESPDAAREPLPSIAVDKDILDCWRVNYGLHREPHALHEFWRNGAPAGAVLALRAAVLEIERLHGAPAADTITRLTAERDAARRDAERYRWLRDKAPGEIVFDHINDDNHFMLIVPFDGEPVHNDEHSGLKLDAAIDAALSAQERGNV